MENFYWLGQIQQQERKLVGEKAFYLNQLLKLGYPVVPGFVVGAGVLREFWQNHKWQEPLFAELPSSSLHFNVEDTPQLSTLAKNIRREITSADLPSMLLSELVSATQQLNAPVLIFRPSVSLPFLGTNKLNIGGLLESHASRCEEKEIAIALKRAWAELFRARSLFYWNRAGIKLQQIGLAVLAQPIWPAVAAGEMYICPNAVEIQATWGLGHAIRAGHAIPDSYQLHPSSGIPVNRQLGNKPIAYYPLETGDSKEGGGSPLNLRLLSEQQQNSYSLQPNELEQLSQMAKKLSTQLGSPSILEWAFTHFDGNLPPQIYLTQAQLSMSANLKMHPETPAKKSATSSTGILRGLPASPGRVSGPAFVMGSLEDGQNLDNLVPGGILIAKSIPPHWQHLLTQVAGVVTEQGAMTSHAAILARELGIPAVVGASYATDSIETGTRVLVDGNTGEVFVNSAETVTVQPLISSESNINLTHSPIATLLFVNLSQPLSLQRLTDSWVDGVGLLRSELLLMELLKNEAKLPSLGRKWIEAIADAVQPFAAAFAPKPVFYRSLDLRSEMSLNSANAALGVHGTFSYTLDPSLFDLELQALVRLQQAGYRNLNLILPFVRSVEEFVFCRRRVEAAGLNRYSSFQVWVMVEVPSLVFLLPDLIAAGVDGFAIGSNDLTQLLLAASREDPLMAVAFDERHPAVLRAFEQIITTAKKAGVPCCFCGAAPARYPELIDKLVRWGVSAISVEPDALSRSYAAISKAEQRLLLDVARQQFSKV